MNEDRIEMDPYSYHEQFGKVTWAKETEAGNGSGCRKWTRIMDMEFGKDSVLT